MKRIKSLLPVVLAMCCLLSIAASPALAANAKYDLATMPDMSDFDPNKPMLPEGDVVKVALVASFSGPAAQAGQAYWAGALWAITDINKRGGIMIDGKKKKILLIKANHESKPAITKKVCERMILQEGVDILIGTNGSNNMKIINQVANKYKKIAMDFVALSDELYDAKNFTPYSFMVCYSTSQIGRVAAYYYGQVRKKEDKFYVLCQDYLFGHSLANGFLEGMKEFYPDAKIVGKDFHKLFLTDFAPFLTKIKASGAQVIYTGDWNPDGANLVKQSRQMGVDLPFAHLFLEDPVFLTEIGIEKSKGLMRVTQFAQTKEAIANPAYVKFLDTWNNQWKTWKAPYNTLTYKWPIGMSGTGGVMYATYWLLSVLDRTGTTDPAKVIKVWEGDTYQYPNGEVATMRAKDHKAYQDLFLVEYVPPEQQVYPWFDGCSYDGPAYRVPASKVMPWSDPELKR